MVLRAVMLILTLALTLAFSQVHAIRTDNPHATTATQVGAVTINQANSITSTMIVDGAIANADISASAAISDTKLGTIRAVRGRWQIRLYLLMWPC